MALFLGTVAAAVLALLGLWQPLLWIGAALVVGWSVFDATGLSRASDPVDGLARTFSRR